MSIEMVTERILKEANNDARRIFEKGRYDGRDVVYQAEHLAEQIMVDRKTQADADASALKNGRMSVAALEDRKLRLSAKQEVVNQCFHLAMEKLTSMTDEDYITFLTQQIVEVAAEGGELLFNEKDRLAVGEKVLAAVNGALNSTAVTLSTETINAKGGFVLRQGAIAINSTLETLVGAVRTEVTPQVVKVLFG